MEILRITFFAFLALFILVSFHEFGHYWVARRCGVKVLRFSIGFGPVLLKFKIKQTEFAFSAIPLGGYVKMHGEAKTPDVIEDDIDTQANESSTEKWATSTDPESFNDKKVWQRMLIVAAGPVANFLLALVLFTMVFMAGTKELVPLIGDLDQTKPAYIIGLRKGQEIVAIDSNPVDSWESVYTHLIRRIGDTGFVLFTVKQAASDANTTLKLPINQWLSDEAKPSVLQSIGLVPFIPVRLPIIAEVMAESAAQKAGVMSGDRILSVNQQPINSWKEWVAFVRASPDKELNLVVLRNQSTTVLKLTPSMKLEEGKVIGLAGVRAVAATWSDELIRKKNYGFIAAVQAASVKTYGSIGMIWQSISKLILGKISTKSLGGPVSIGKIAGDSASAGWTSFVTFIAIMSVMLGVMNLLPIPVLDGGHLLFYIVELVKGSAVNEQIQAASMRFGMVLLLGFTSLALYNDFMRL